MNLDIGWDVGYRNIAIQLNLVFMADFGYCNIAIWLYLGYCYEIVVLVTLQY